MKSLDTQEILSSDVSNRYFWKTMRSDVVKWINNCPQCSSRKRKPAEMGAESHLEALSLPQTHDDVDRCAHTWSCCRMSEESRNDTLSVCF